MTGYFDRMAARAVGREPRVVLRRRFRFEPERIAALRYPVGRATALVSPGDGSAVTDSIAVGDGTDIAVGIGAGIGSDGGGTNPLTAATGDPGHEVAEAMRHAEGEPGRTGSVAPGRPGRSASEPAAGESRTTPLPVPATQWRAGRSGPASRPEPSAREWSTGTGAAGPGPGAVESRVARRPGDGESPGTTTPVRNEDEPGMPAGPLTRPAAVAGASVPNPPPPAGQPDQEDPWAPPLAAAADASSGAVTVTDSPPDALPGAAGNEHPPVTDHRAPGPAPLHASPPQNADGPARSVPDGPSGTADRAHSQEPGGPRRGVSGADPVTVPPHDAAHGQSPAATPAPIDGRSPEPGEPRPSPPRGTEAEQPPPRAGARPRPVGPSITPTAPDLLELVREHVVPTLIERGLIAPGSRPTVRRSGQEPGGLEPAGPDVATDRPTIVAGRLRLTPPSDGPVRPEPEAGEVHVHIDRIDVHPPASPTSLAPKPEAPRPGAPDVDLKAYLAARRGERP